MPAGLALARAPLGRVMMWWLGIAIALLVGLRFEVGGDWGSYVGYLIRAQEFSLAQNLALGDPGYQLLNSVAAALGAGVWFVNLVCAAVFAAGLTVFARRLPDSLLAVAVAMPYLVIVVAMGYTRQAVAIGLAMIGLAYLTDRRNAWFVFYIALAASFHKSAVLLLPFAVLANTRRRLATSIWVGIAGAVFYLVFLAEHAQRLWYNYVQTDYAYASEGALIRVSMNALPAAVFLLLHRRIPMTTEQRALWFWVSVFSLACLGLVMQAPTAVDRMALYFIPLQLVVWSYLPLRFVGSQRALVRYAILVFYGAVLFVWLNYATHAFAWLPYQFWPVVGE
ncbi:EpsG family protein [Salinisphaera sp. P385]|uniref:EpsG family protein n=1 Tax=Spectribacter acetivorans TaxID=3075603 RepID=A0ABU3BBM4_9GAMM|nr:EpsG family protein [Salinisphaera sp. P385]MDT0619868.1 EpsG family protein [Salinisphaera sp. P385]